MPFRAVSRETHPRQQHVESCREDAACGARTESRGDVNPAFSELCLEVASRLTIAVAVDRPPQCIERERSAHAQLQGLVRDRAPGLERHSMRTGSYVSDAIGMDLSSRVPNFLSFPADTRW